MPEINEDKIKLALSELLGYLEKNASKNLIDETQELSVQINLKKIPIVRGFHRFYINIPHSYYEDLDTCLFVKNINEKDIDDDLEVHQWQKILKSEAEFPFTKVITFHQLKTEYKQYEAKRSLCNSYDIFFADQRIVQYFSPILGKVFVDKKKWPIGLTLDSTRSIKGEVSRTFHKAFCTLSGKGSSCEMAFGHTKMPLENLLDNVTQLLKQIDLKIPGNTSNIHSLYLKPKKGGGPSLPLYISLDDPNLVPTPKLLKPKLELDDFEEITTVDGALVRVLPDGRIEFKKIGSDTTDSTDKVKKGTKNGKRPKKSPKIAEMGENDSDITVKLEETYVIHDGKSKDANNSASLTTHQATGEEISISEKSPLPVGKKIKLKKKQGEPIKSVKTGEDVKVPKGVAKTKRLRDQSLNGDEEFASDNEGHGGEIVKVRVTKPSKQTKNITKLALQTNGDHNTVLRKKGEAKLVSQTKAIAKSELQTKVEAKSASRTKAQAKLALPKEGILKARLVNGDEPRLVDHKKSIAAAAADTRPKGHSKNNGVTWIITPNPTTAIVGAADLQNAKVATKSAKRKRDNESFGSGGQETKMSGGNKSVVAKGQKISKETVQQTPLVKKIKNKFLRDKIVATEYVVPKPSPNPSPKIVADVGGKKKISSKKFKKSDTAPVRTSEGKGSTKIVTSNGAGKKNAHKPQPVSLKDKKKVKSASKRKE